MARKQLGMPPTNSTDATPKSYVDSVATGPPNATLINPTLVNYTEAMVQLGVVGSNYALSLTSGTMLVATLTASALTTFAMPSPSPGKSFVLLINQPLSTGGQGSAVFPGVQWSFGAAPTITSTPGAMNILSFISDGTYWYGSFAQGYISATQDPTAGAQTAILLPNPSSPMYPLGRALNTLRQVKRSGKIDNLQAN